VAKALESGSDLFYGFLQNAERMRPIALSLMLRGLLSFAGFLTVLVLTGNLLWADCMATGKEAVEEDP